MPTIVKVKDGRGSTMWTDAEHAKRLPGWEVVEERKIEPPEEAAKVQAPAAPPVEVPTADAIGDAVARRLAEVLPAPVPAAPKVGAGKIAALVAGGGAAGAAVLEILRGVF